MPGIQIVKITQIHREQYVELLKRERLLRPYTFPPTPLQELFPEETDTRFSFGYIKNGRLCGVVTFNALVDSQRNIISGHISRMYIPQSVQVPTAGQRMLTTLLRTVRESYPEIRSITVQVAAHHESVIKLYTKFGFDRDYSLRTFHGTGSHFYLDTMLLSMNQNEYENTLPATRSL